MKYATFCSGIEAPSVAWHGLGWKPVLFSEIDKYCCKLLSYHYPDVPNVGDMKKFYNEIKTNPIKYRGTADLICAGTPCQSFSLAGLRKGLDDPRGNLALVFLGLIEVFRPTWVVWENVPGVFSSWTATGAPDENGEWEETNDFHTFISALQQLGYGVASRVLDAQYFGVPQRRRRVFVVGHLGDWRRSAAVLFDSSCMRGNPSASRKTGSSVAALTENGVGTCGADDNQAQAGHLIEHTLRGEGFDAGEDGTGRGLPLVFGGNKTSGATKVHPALNAAKSGSRRMDFESEAFIFQPKQSVTQSGVPGPISPSLDRSKSEGLAVFNIRGREDGANIEIDPDNLCSIRASSGGSSRSYLSTPGIRRITPIEAERLQGFPDDYTNVIYRGKKAADGPRYRAIGNSMAVPVMEWIGNRIDQVQKLINDGTI